MPIRKKNFVTTELRTLMTVSNLRQQRNRVPFEAKKLLVNDLLASPGMPYVVPSFQRPYCWSKEQVEQLVRDLLDFYWLQQGRSRASEYSLGTVVCERTSSWFSILDGQQRLTTLDLLLNHISQQIEPELEQRRRLIASYQYLPKSENASHSGLPYHEKQEEAISGEIKEYFKELGIEQSGIPWGEIENCILRRVYVTRVTLPLSEKNQGEAEKMFEIINVSGQKLSLLDQIKARLLSFIPEGLKRERSLVSCFLDDLPELLSNPEQAKKGFEIKQISGNVENLKEETLEKIIEQSSEEEVWEIEKARFDDKIKKNSGLKDDELDGDENTESAKTDEGEPPIDAGNLLIVSNELLRYSLGKNIKKSNKRSEKEFSLKLGYRNFDWLSQGDTSDCGTMSPSEKVLRLIGTTNLLLQFIGHWGVYRPRGESSPGEVKPMRALQFSFMAENRFHNDAQYWFLMLAANALCGPTSERPSLYERSTAVDSFQKNWTLSSEQLKKLQPLVFRRLIGWAVHRAFTSETGTDAAMRWALLSDSEFQEKFKEEVRSLSQAVKSWNYNDGLRHWQLYFLDWILWCDARNGRAKLRKILKTYVTEKPSVKNALQHFSQADFNKILKNFRIVQHGAIEHWCARKTAGKDSEVLEKLNGFGNLALIDTSLNSSLRDLPVREKSKYVRDNMANHSLKLGWLAVFTATYPDYGENDVETLTDFWGAYMSSYPYEELLKNP